MMVMMMVMVLMMMVMMAVVMMSPPGHARLLLPLGLATAGRLGDATAPAICRSEGWLRLLQV